MIFLSQLTCTLYNVLDLSCKEKNVWTNLLTAEHLTLALPTFIAKAGMIFCSGHYVTAFDPSSSCCSFTELSVYAPFVWWNLTFKWFVHSSLLLRYVSVFNDSQNLSYSPGRCSYKSWQMVQKMICGLQGLQGINLSTLNWAKHVISGDVNWPHPTLWVVCFRWGYEVIQLSLT